MRNLGLKTISVSLLLCVCLSACVNTVSRGDSERAATESETAQTTSSLAKAFTEATLAGGVSVQLLDESCQVDEDEYGRDFAKGTRYFNLGYSVKNTNPFPVYVAILGTLNASLSGSSTQVLSESGTEFATERFNQDFFGLWFPGAYREPGQIPCSDVDVSIELIVHKCLGCNADGSWKGIPAIQECLTLRCAIPASTTTTTTLSRQSATTGNSIDTGDWILNYQDLGVVTQRLKQGDWIAIVASIDDSSSLSQKRESVSSVVNKLHARNIDGPGNILLSKNFPGLKSGYVVVFAGPYSTSQSASEFCAMAGLAVPSECYPRLPIP